MCGIAGIFYLNTSPVKRFVNHQHILELLKHRGPDFQTYYESGHATLYHSRLQIIDTSQASNQPFVGDDKKQAMVFNGEIFNYKDLQKTQSHLKTNGDVEVLFNLLRDQGTECLNTLNGFFAFAFYNEAANTLLLGRDRLGVKPLYYYKDNEVFAFASELKPLMELIGKQALNQQQIYTYFRLNYCAGKETIFENVYRLLPGEVIELKNGNMNIATWYQAPKINATKDFYTLLDDAVKLRLNADVPLGTFLSGGVDSSIISALAIKHKKDLNTFSIGFENEHFFDETHYSELVAKHIGSNHHVFKLKEHDFLHNIDAFLNCIDEPFADSSAFNFYMLSKFTQKQVKVALSGDGADELFKGYNKHKALLLSQNRSQRLMARTAGLMLGKANNSRDGKWNNKLRQLKKFNQLAKLSALEKQKFLASISNNNEVKHLLLQTSPPSYFDGLFTTASSFSTFALEDTFDIQTVLADDMLVKADRFSMQHGIEIRNPFLDYRVLEFALNVNSSAKINKQQQKIILQQSFASLLPAEIFSRRKKGFELPLQKWLSLQLQNKLKNEWLNAEKITQQGLLNTQQVMALQDKLFSTNPEDSAAKVWAVIIFEAWLDNFKEYIK
jgi:asparagine synthase (glutamine-hydrolysing)